VCVQEPDATPPHIKMDMFVFEDSVPCRVRAKRGCATHPRSIAERVRRTRISDRIRKLQELVPNMDKVLFPSYLNSYFIFKRIFCRMYFTIHKAYRKKTQASSKIVIYMSAGIQIKKKKKRSCFVKQACQQ